MRIGELSNMHMSDVDFEAGRVVIPTTKNGDRRIVRLDTEALKALKRYQRHGR